MREQEHRMCSNLGPSSEQLVIIDLVRLQTRERTTVGSYYVHVAGTWTIPIMIMQGDFHDILIKVNIVKN